jgi:hypothetical protein
MNYLNKTHIQNMILSLEKQKETLLESGILDIELVVLVGRIEREMNDLVELSIQVARLPKRRRLDGLVG